MKNIIVIVLLASTIGLLFYSCETTGIYEVNDTLVSNQVDILYLQNPSARYQINFGNTRISDSLPYLEKKALIYSSKVVYLKKNDEQSLKIWRIDLDENKTLESSKIVNSKNPIKLLQISDKTPLLFYNTPESPPEDKTTQTNIHFFYADDNQPEQVTITILAVEYFTFLTSGQNFNKLALDKKTEIATFILNKSDFSKVVNLDLDLYKQINKIPTAYYYKITNSTTGKIIQDYNKLNKITITVGTTPETNLNPKFKSSLFQWKFTSSTVPFNINSQALINGDSW